jgi:hypothetical protein
MPLVSRDDAFVRHGGVVDDRGYLIEIVPNALTDQGSSSIG